MISRLWEPNGRQNNFPNYLVLRYANSVVFLILFVIKTFAVNKLECTSQSILQKPFFETADMNVMRPGGGGGVSIGYLGCSDLVGEH